MAVSVFAVHYFVTKQSEKILQVNKDVEEIPRFVKEQHKDVPQLLKNVGEIHSFAQEQDKRLSLIENNVDEVRAARKEIAQLNTLLSKFFLPPDAPAQNHTGVKDESVELSEERMMNLPEDIKIEIEGDVVTPSEF